MSDGASETAAMHETEASVADVMRVAKTMREAGRRTSFTADVVEHMLGQALVANYEVLDYMKSRRQDGALTEDVVKDVAPRLRLIQKLVTVVISTFLTHDVEEHFTEGQDEPGGKSS